MISKEAVKKIADLARLRLSEPEIVKIQSDLGEILDYIGLLNQVDVSLVALESGFFELENIVRKDAPFSESQSIIDAILNQAPAKQDNFFKVKRVIA